VRLLRLYPKAWRRRYEAEMQALLDQHEVTVVTRLDLLRGALDAWLFDRRFAMSPTTPVLRGARLGLIPCALVVAQFLLRLDLRADPTLLNLLGNAIPVSIAVACLWVGKHEAERGTDWSARLAAGAAAGAAGTLAATVVHGGLLLADLRFAITPSVIALQGGSVSGDGFAVVASQLLGPRELWATAAAVVVAVVAGAVIGSAGALLRGVRITRTAAGA
jgi:hypothetical protein